MEFNLSSLHFQRDRNILSWSMLCKICEYVIIVQFSWNIWDMDVSKHER